VGDQLELRLSEPRLAQGAEERGQAGDVTQRRADGAEHGEAPPGQPAAPGARKVHVTLTVPREKSRRRGGARLCEAR